MSRKSSNTALNSGQDWIVDAGGIQILIEKIGRIVKNHIADRLQMFSNELEDLAHHPPDEQGYRLINGYRVREIFAGEESLTNLLTQYKERTIALHY